jgi:transglutaminase-like putative cysteine protease
LATAAIETTDTQGLRRIRITYGVEIAPHVAPVRLWLPLPRTTACQIVNCVDLNVPNGKSPADMRGDASLYFVAPSRAETMAISVSYDVLRRKHRLGVPITRRAAPSERDLLPDRRVPVTGGVVDDALALLAAHDSPTVRTRRIYQYVLDTFDYDTRGCTFERNHTLGDLDKACDLRLGTCTELHGVLVSCLRAAGVPARFIFGFNVPSADAGRIPGYHCWAEAFLPETGWTSIDVSEARKRSDAEGRAFYFGNLDPNRVEFTIGRDLVLSPPQQGEPLDKFIFPYGESEGSPFPVVPTISFQDHDATHSKA